MLEEKISLSIKVRFDYEQISAIFDKCNVIARSYLAQIGVTGHEM